MRRTSFLILDNDLKGKNYFGYPLIDLFKQEDVFLQPANYIKIMRLHSK
jgi:hypothetical protein